MLNPEILEQLASPFGHSAADAAFIRASQNLVYRIDKPQSRYILRIAANRHLTVPLVGAELKWIQRLSHAGFNTCLPVPANDGRLVIETTIGDDHYFTTCFEHAPGTCTRRKDADETFFVRFGALTGKLHAFACEDRAWQLQLARPQWHQSRLLNEDVARVQGVIDPAFEPALRSLINELQQHPYLANNHGLLHGDLGFGNLFDDGQALWLIDFDNCEFGHFLQDLSVVLYDSIYYKALYDCPGEDTSYTMQRYWHAFLKGYQTHTPLDHIDTQVLSQYFLLREALLYVYFFWVVPTQKQDARFHKDQAQKVTNLVRQTHAIDIEAMTRSQAHIATS